MRRLLPVLSFVLLTSDFCLLSSAAPLPTFEDFRRVDRMRRLTGQLQTTELLRVTTIDRKLVLLTGQAAAATNDYRIIWGAAELLGDWPTRRALFDLALAVSHTNPAVAVRYASFAAQAGDAAIALPLVRVIKGEDSGNIVPWLLELKTLQVQQKAFAEMNLPPSWAMRFRDCGAEAAQARIRLLEAAGYSAYSARRLGFMPDTPAQTVARDFAEHGSEKAAGQFLLTVARGMQERATFLITELVGQTLERAVMVGGVEGQSQAEITMRLVELDKRREEVKALLSAMERRVVDMATESEMVQYFDNVLALGEELAMKKLAQTVHTPLTP